MDKNSDINMRLAKTKLTVAIFAFTLLQYCGTIFALPTTVNQAEKVVKGWLKSDASPLGQTLGQQILQVETHSDTNGQSVYYVVYLQPSGFVIVSADDLIEPIVAFADDGVFDPSLDNPLGALVSQDLEARVALSREVKSTQNQTLQGQTLSVQNKWNQLVSLAEESEGRNLQMGLSGISDVWVEPLIQSKWGQTTVCGMKCYNYYTPNYYPCGCVATAMAQLMRFHEHPTSGVGVKSFTIYVDGYPQTEYLRGGNGSGGPYDWDNMILIPNCSITTSQRQAISALCYDAGVAVEMQYAASGSGAYIYKAGYRLMDTFNYGNAIDGWNYNANIGAGLNGMVNPNLDSGYPVLLGISSDSSGHAIVTDGYGYNYSTLYHHLNMGWSGSDDAWYNLPNINSYPSYDVINECIYNIYTSGYGEIISGRITNPSGNPISGATVTAQKIGGGLYSTITDSRGVYALPKVPSASTYTIAVTKAGYSFTPASRIASTGTSTNDEATSGNRWGIDFQGNNNNHNPQLSNGFVTPDSGDTDTDFCWYVDYYDADGDTPLVKTVYVDGIAHTMYLDSGSDANGTYIYGPTKLNPGDHSYYFSFSDGNGGDDRLPSTGDSFGPSITEIICPEGDLNGDCCVDWFDHGIFVSQWLQSANVEPFKLTAEDGAASDYFGYSVSICDDYAIMGAYGDDSNGSSSGAAYIFKYDGTSWIQQAKLTVTDGAASDYFGRSVSISDNYVVVGAYGNDDNGSSSGAAYIFKYDGTSWIQQTKLTASDGAASDYFGYSVSISTDSTVIGAYSDDENGTNSGSAYIFRRNGTSWTEQEKLLAPDGANGDYFGYSVSVHKNNTIISMHYDDDGGNSNSGSAYIFGLCPTADLNGDYHVDFVDYSILAKQWKQCGE